MPNRVMVVSRRAMAVPPARARVAVWDIQNIERTEVKADTVTVTRESPTVGSYTVRGHFAGVPWRGQFFYELNPNGFHSKNAPRPGKGSTIEGGFAVEDLGGDACVVMHYEQYRLPWYFRPLRLGIIAYLKASMRRELRDLERLVRDGSDAGSLSAAAW
jgi:hypothetical protein